MNILIAAHTFYPNIGGIETFTDTLATELVKLGHTITIVTPTPHKQKDNTPYTIIRQPTHKQLFHLIQQTDIYYQSNISLRTAWPLLFIKKPWVITYHIWITDPKNKTCSVPNSIKHACSKIAHNIAISPFIASTLQAPSTVIPDPYNDSIFKRIPTIQKTKDIVFVGRLEPEKGIHLALHALHQLKHKKLYPTLTIIGKGSQEKYLKELTHSLNLQTQVTFLGPLQFEKLNLELNAHTIMVVPSIWKEPFGIVALEGIATGCVVIGSEEGGLKNAIGPCGITFPNGDIDSLAHSIQNILEKKIPINYFLEKAPKHLEQFKAQTIAKQYIEFFEKILHQ